MISLKNILFDKILNFEIKIDFFIEDVADSVPGSNNLRLKSEY